MRWVGAAALAFFRCLAVRARQGGSLVACIRKANWIRLSAITMTHPARLGHIKVPALPSLIRCDPALWGMP